MLNFDFFDFPGHNFDLFEKIHFRDEPFNIYREVPKNDKKIVCRRKQLEKNCLQIVCPKKNCLHGNFEDFENFKISACSKDAFLFQLTRQHSITFSYTF